MDNSILENGNPVTFESNQRGWPVPYYTGNCWGIGENCKWTSNFDVQASAANGLIWLLTACLSLVGYRLILEKRKGKKRRK